MLIGAWCWWLLLGKHKVDANEILTEVRNHPETTARIFDHLWELAVEGGIESDPRIFSDIAHDAGMIIGDQGIDLVTAFSYCGTSFKQACMHGVIMEYIDRMHMHNNSVPEMLYLCDVFSDSLSKRNCYHGVGHEFAATMHGTLIQTLSFCKNLHPEESMESACESGVLMEYSKEPTEFKELPCKDLPDEFKRVCYASEGSYQQYYPGQKEFFASYQYCSAVPKQYVLSCMLGVSERALMATAKNADRAYAFCLENNILQDICLDSLISVSKTQFHDETLAKTLAEYGK